MGWGEEGEQQKHLCTKVIRSSRKVPGRESKALRNTVLAGSPEALEFMSMRPSNLRHDWTVDVIRFSKLSHGDRTTAPKGAIVMTFPCHNNRSSQSKAERP